MITPNFKAVNFSIEIRERRLDGSVNREMEVDSEGSCRLQFAEENDCLSCNFGFNENHKTKFMWQLCNSDGFFWLEEFTENHEFPCQGIKVISFKGIKLN